MQCKLRGAGHSTSTGPMTSVMWHIAEAFPPAGQETILSNHRVIGIATNTSMMLSCALMTYLMMTADVGLLVVAYRGIHSTTSTGTSKFPNFNFSHFYGLAGPSGNIVLQKFFFFL